MSQDRELNISHRYSYGPQDDEPETEGTKALLGDQFTISPSTLELGVSSEVFFGPRWSGRLAIEMCLGAAGIEEPLSQ